MYKLILYSISKLRRPLPEVFDNKLRNNSKIFILKLRTYL